MHSDELRPRIRGPGFRPFRLHLTDGRNYDVPHPEFIAVGHAEVVIMDQRGIKDVIDPAHVVSLEKLEPA